MGVLPLTEKRIIDIFLDTCDGIRAGGANDNKLGEWLTGNGIEVK